MSSKIFLKNFFYKRRNIKRFGEYIIIRTKTKNNDLMEVLQMNKLTMEELLLISLFGTDAQKEQAKKEVEKRNGGSN